MLSKRSATWSMFGRAEGSACVMSSTSGRRNSKPSFLERMTSPVFSLWKPYVSVRQWRRPGRRGKTHVEEVLAYPISQAIHVGGEGIIWLRETPIPLGRVVSLEFWDGLVASENGDFRRRRVDGIIANGESEVDDVVLHGTFGASIRSFGRPFEIASHGLAKGMKGNRKERRSVHHDIEPVEVPTVHHER